MPNHVTNMFQIARNLKFMKVSTRDHETFALYDTKTNTFKLTGYLVVFTPPPLFLVILAPQIPSEW